MPARSPSSGTVSERSRLVAGVMSGTSLDGVDVALVHLEGSGPGLSCRTVDHTASPFPAALRDLLLTMAESESVRVDDLALMHVRLAHEYARAVREALSAAGIGSGELALVGCHGQTVRHLPDPRPIAGEEVSATLQLGSGPVLANLLGVPVVTDFRAADMALGGQGAPLVPYVDFVLLGDPDETRIALNIGGIANLTVLPAGGALDAVTAFDTGPGNMVSDALASRHLGEPYDRDGTVASSGSVDRELLAGLLADPWYRRPPPRSTGREAFGRAFVDAFDRRADERGLSPSDRIATAAALTTGAVVDAIGRFVLPDHRVARMLVSGGGVHNRAMMRGLAEGLPGTTVESTAGHGLDPDAKEAVAFAVLAHETIDRVPTGLPTVTGATRPAIQGSVSYPH